MFDQRPRLQNPTQLPVVRRVLAAAAFALLLVLACPFADSQQNDLKIVASSLAREISTANRHTVTVADFTDLQGNVTELGRFIAEELSTQLVVNGKSFTIVERIQLAAILKEHQISVSGLVDPATIRKLGQFAGVDAIVTGTLVPFSDYVHLTAKVLDVSTAKVIAVSTSDLPRTKAIDDLLSRGISTGGNTAQENSAPATSASRPTQLHSTIKDDFLLVIKNCIRRGDRTFCSGSVTNRADKPRELGIHQGPSRTTAVDNNGNSYIADQAHVGQPDGGDRQQLMPDLPVNFYFSFPATDPTATQISVVFAYWADGINESKVLFRNISLAQK